MVGAMKKLVACLAFLAASASAIPPIMPPGPPPSPPPRLLVVISVDQLSSDLFEAYRQHFTAGLARVQLGTSFLNGYQSHAATETCPGHSTILTGARPAQTGIIANNWIDQSAAREDKSVYCAEDERVPGSTFRKYTVSPEHLRVTTLGERLKAAAPASRNFAVAGKDRSAVMMGGRNVDQRWYWDGNRFSTDRKGAAEPRTVTALNAALEPRIAAPAAGADLPALCQAKAKPYPLTRELTVGAGRLERADGDKSGFRASPDFDGATLALAAGLVQEFQLGRGQATTDIVSIGLAATDYVGHTFGTGGSEMCLQLLGLDRELGSFFSVLDSTGVDYALVLTSDHGAMDIPERLRDQGIAQAARADKALVASSAGRAIGARLGLKGPVILGDGTSGDMWIDRSLSARDRTRALAAAVQFYRAHPQVAAVFTARELAAAPKPTGHVRNWSLKARARASFDPARSGDFVVLLKEYVSPIAEPGRGYVAGHGTPWDYDRRVPILFWRRGASPAVSGEHVETADIMPTAAAMIGLAIDRRSIDGQCLAGISGVACPPR
jgi:predicted AlkP superfamily pyrophosphatase or phosphodiesterase